MIVGIGSDLIDIRCIEKAILYLTNPWRLRKVKL